MNATELLVNEVGDTSNDTEFTTRGRTITEADLTNFSALTGDWHPQHSDAHWASESRFSRRVAHGMLVLSYAIGLLPLDPERVVALRGLKSVTFKRPVAIGDTIRVHCRVEATQSLDDGHALTQLAIRILNQTDRLVTMATVEAICKTTPELPTKGGSRPPGQAGQAEDPDPATTVRSWSQEMMGLYGGELYL